MEPKRTVRYSDLLNDDFAGTKINTRPVGKDFPFVHRSFLWNLLSFIVYYLIAAPIAFLVCKLYLGLRFENRKVLRSLRKTGYVLYGNHTRAIDALIPPMAAFPKKAYIIAGPDAVSLPGLKNIVQMLGAIPLPSDFSGMRNFMSAVSLRLQKKNCLAIYPEAHIWPFYTGIRPFSDASFLYPVKEKVPAVAMVTTYRRRRGLFRFCEKPGMTVTFSEPIYPCLDSSPRVAQHELREKVFHFMTEVSSSKENLEYIRYVPAEPPEKQTVVE